MTKSGVALLILTVLTWALLAAILPTVIGADGTGDRDIFLGLRWLFADVLLAVLWLALLGLVVVAGNQGRISGGVKLGAVIVILISAASACAGVYLSSKLGLRWPMAIVMAIPPLIAGYLLALYQPWMISMQASPIWNIAIGGAVLMLSAAVWPALVRHQQETSVQQVAQEKEFAAMNAIEKERQLTDNVAKLQGMRPDQHLVDWYGLLEPDSGVRPQAIEALKKVERRQGDVIEGLNYGIPAIMKLVPELDLKPTPELCAAAQAYLAKTAKGLALDGRAPYPYTRQESIDGSLAGIGWFNAHGCKCNDGIAALEAVVRTYQDSAERHKLLQSLGELK